MKGSLPIPYIVALIIAVVIIVVATFLFLTQSGSWQNTMHQKYCEAKEFEYCNNPNADPGDWDTSCSGPPSKPC